MGPTNTKSKITAKKLATLLRRIVYPERPSEVIEGTHAFKAASTVVGEERLLDELAWLMFFAVDVGLGAGLSGERERELVRRAFLENLRKGTSRSFVDAIVMRNLEYRKAIGDASDDRGCIGRRFVEFCGLGDNVAVVIGALVLVLFVSTAKQATKLVEKYSLTN